MAEAVSAAILNWNGGDMVVECLRSLLRQTHPIEDRIVVDNGSTDGSPEFLLEKFPHVRLIALDDNLGFGGGSNRGFSSPHD